MLIFVTLHYQIENTCFSPILAHMFIYYIHVFLISLKNDAHVFYYLHVFLISLKTLRSCLILHSCFSYYFQKCAHVFYYLHVFLISLKNYAHGLYYIHVFLITFKNALMSSITFVFFLFKTCTHVL